MADTDLTTPDAVSTYSEGRITTDDPRLPDLISAASAAIRNYCGWDIFPAQDYTVNEDGGTNVLYIHTLKLNAITSITADGELLDPASYEVSYKTANARRTHGRRFGRHWGGVQISYNGGYSAVPADLAQIVNQVVTAACVSPLGATSESVGGIAVRWGSVDGVTGGMGLLARDLTTLDKYKITWRL